MQVQHQSLKQGRGSPGAGERLVGTFQGLVCMICQIYKTLAEVVDLIILARNSGVFCGSFPRFKHGRACHVFSRAVLWARRFRVADGRGHNTILKYKKVNVHFIRFNSIMC